MNKKTHNPLSIRILLVVLISVPIIINLVFINIFFFANNRIKESQLLTMHSLEIKSHTKYLMFNFDMLKFEYVNQNPHIAPHRLAIRDERINRLYETIEDKLTHTIRSEYDKEYYNSEIAQILEEIKAFKEATLESTERVRIIDTFKVRISKILSEEDYLERLRKTNLIESVDEEFVLLIYALIVTVLISVLIILVFKVSFFKPISSIVQNIHNAKEGKGFTLRSNFDDNPKNELVLLEKEFKDLYDQFEEKREENELFLYSVSHDLKTPLLNLQLYSKELHNCMQSVKDKLDSGDLESVKSASVTIHECFDSFIYIESSIMKISNMVGSLLRFGRAGNQVMQLEKIDLNHKIEGVLSSINSIIEEANAKVTCDKLPIITGDRVALSQIFTNLITNSIRYMDEARPLEIHIGIDSARSNDSRKVIFVEDNARGIPREYLDKMFVPYSQLNKGEKGGYGLGLSIVKKLVDKLDAEILVESTENVGTKFLLIFKT